MSIERDNVSIKKRILLYFCRRGKHRYEFYHCQGYMVYACFVCGKIIPCSRIEPVNSYAHLIASKGENGELVVKNRHETENSCNGVKVGKSFWAKIKDSLLRPVGGKK